MGNQRRARLRLITFPAPTPMPIERMPLEHKLRELIDRLPDEADVIEGMIDRLLATDRVPMERRH